MVEDDDDVACVVVVESIVDEDVIDSEVELWNVEAWDVEVWEVEVLDVEERAEDCEGVLGPQVPPFPSLLPEFNE